MTNTSIKCWNCGAIYPTTDTNCPSCGKTRRYPPLKTAFRLLKFFLLLGLLAFVIFGLGALIIYSGESKITTIELSTSLKSKTCGTIKIPGWYGFNQEKATQGSLEAWPVKSIFRPKKNFVIYAGCIDFPPLQESAVIDDKFLRNAVLYNYRQAIEKGRVVDIWEAAQNIQFNGLPAASAVLYYHTWEQYQDVYEYTIQLQLSDNTLVLLSAAIFPSDWPTERDTIYQVFETFAPEK